MGRTLTVTDARAQLLSLAENLEKKPGQEAITITRRGKPVLALLSWELYDSLLETMEILGDEDLMKSFRRGVREIEEGKGIPWEEAKKRLER